MQWRRIRRTGHRRLIATQIHAAVRTGVATDSDHRFVRLVYHRVLLLFVQLGRHELDDAIEITTHFLPPIIAGTCQKKKPNASVGFDTEVTVNGLKLSFRLGLFDLSHLGVILKVRVSLVIEDSKCSSIFARVSVPICDI